MSNPDPTRLLPEAQRRHRNRRSHVTGDLKFDDIGQGRDFTRGVGNADKSSCHTVSERFPLRVLSLSAVMDDMRAILGPDRDGTSEK